MDMFFSGFEKAAGMAQSMIRGASKGNLEAVAQTAKREAAKRLGPGAVDLGDYWNKPLNIKKWGQK